MVTKKNSENAVKKSFKAKPVKSSIDLKKSMSSTVAKKKTVNGNKISEQMSNDKNFKKPKSLENFNNDRKSYSGSTITLKQVISGDGRGKKQIGTLKGLGLNKINKISTLQDTVAIRGMINKVNHLIKIISEGKDNVK